ncbi:MAG: hypothetical protein MHM6MM_006747 [Cercozoa sp. M6MM]
MQVSLDDRAEVWLARVAKRGILRELRTVVADSAALRALQNGEVTIVSTFQLCDCDIVDFTPEAQQQKDLLLFRFYVLQSVVCQALLQRGFWCDFFDPPSGIPALSPSAGPSLFSEADVLCRLFPGQLKQHQVSNCHVISHPRFGLRVYPASMLTSAPAEVVSEVLASTLRLREKRDSDRNNNNTAPSWTEFLRQHGMSADDGDRATNEQTALRCIQHARQTYADFLAQQQSIQ